MKNNSSLHTLVMGVLNITPDSYSDGGLYGEDPGTRLLELVNQGADIIDIGAESSGPNSKPISLEEELDRLSKLFHSSQFMELKSKVVMSIDTYKAEVAERALSEGFQIVNDISALRNNNRMAKVVADHNAEIILMFSKENGISPHVSATQINYISVFQTIVDFFEERIEYSIKNGIPESKIILDTGMGAFLGDNPEVSWEVVESLGKFKNKFSKFRFLCGVSRKSFISSLVKPEVLDIASKCVELDLIRSGIDIVRTHDVELLKNLIPLVTRKTRADF